MLFVSLKYLNINLPIFLKKAPVIGADSRLLIKLNGLPEALPC
jgi:hypothetical protein